MLNASTDDMDAAKPSTQANAGLSMFRSGSWRLKVCKPLACLMLLWACVGMPAWGHPPPERFDAQTWSVLRTEVRRPAIVVFTTAHCPTCPEVFASIAQWRAQQMPNAPLVAVLMDGRDPLVPDPTATSAQRHLRAADRLFAFEGPQAALRYSVDPTWRGVTPYVALIPAAGPVTFSAGAPTEMQWAALKASATPSAQIRR